MVTTTLKKIVYPCWKPSVEGDGGNSFKGADGSGIVDGLWWYKDLGNHVNGEFSMALVQANNNMEDQSQLETGSLSLVESGPQGTFVGIYDGHAGPEASQFINEHLFDNIKKFTLENQGMSADVINKAFLATEEEFLSLVKRQWLSRPNIASVGSCCLVGMICNGILYVANAGDSRAVLGRTEKAVNEVKAVQVSTEHNACYESVREELRLLHPDDPHIVVLKHTVWRVRGLIQVSRSIGDAYLKRQEFNRAPLLPKFRLSEPFDKPILKAEPSILVQRLYPEDQFLIFASDGLWEHLTNQEAVDIVKISPRNGVARKLVKAALHEAAKKREMRFSDLNRVDRGGVARKRVKAALPESAKKREMRYSDLNRVGRGVRRGFHDDITVIVLFLDFHLISRRSSSHIPLC